MWPWRCLIIAVSLGQIAAGIASLIRAADEEVGQFALAVCLAVGGLGLIAQATTFFREVAILANLLLALVFLPGLFAGLIGLFYPEAGPGPKVLPVLVAAAMVVGSAASARALWRLAKAANAQRAKR
jgi:hypothetical protein